MPGEADCMKSGLQRTWDSFDVYLFDIDGTLLQCSDATHYFAFCHTLTQVSGRPLNLDGVTAHGNTDVGILRDALSLAGIPDGDWRPRLPEIRKAMCRYVEERESDICPSVMPQVHEVLQHLSKCGATLGLATGNLKAIGELKLGRAGLLGYFQFAGWSDEFEFRADVICAAIARAKETAGPTASLCVVGDTPADVAAARANGLSVIGVATGIYGLDELAVAQPDLCVHSLGELLSPS